MRNRIKNILLLLPLFLAGCNDDLDRYSPQELEDTMHLTVSASDITLSQDLGNEVAVTFSWSEASNIEAGAQVTYYFKMDIAENDFASSIDKIEIPAGDTQISFTHRQLNSYLTKWGIEDGTSATLEAELIADIAGTSEYIKPELSTVTFNATGYYVAAKDLFIMGSAVGASSPDVALKMEEVLSEQQYRWNGVMQSGTYKFVLSQESSTPSYTQGTDANTLVYNEEGSTAKETLFTITKAGFYDITVDVDALTLSAVYPTTSYTDIWAVGDAVPAGWNIMSADKLEKDPVNQVAFVYEGNLSAGELKFPLELNEDWNVPFLMPVENGTGVTGDNRMERVEAGGHDYKWNISSTEAGWYKVTLNTYTMTINFERQEDKVIPEDVPYHEVYMIGDATPNEWSVDQATQLSYDYDGEKGTFVWTGSLKAGTLKFPLSKAGFGNMDYLMPKNVIDHRASLSETEMKFVSAADADSNDDQWEVTADEAGTYQITVNVMDMTVTFEKQ